MINNTRKPTSSELGEVEHRERVYKVVRGGTWGKGLYSALTGRFGGSKTKNAPCLTYASGKVTTDATGGKGIFIYLDKDYARDQAVKMAEKVDGRQLSIYEAKPIGAVTIPAGKSKTATCRALLLLDCAVRVPKPEVWMDITDTVTFKATDINVVGMGNGWYFAQTTPKGWAACSGLPATYKVEILNGGASFRVLKKA